MKSWSKDSLSKKIDPELHSLYMNVQNLEGRKYNRAVSGYIIDELLDKLSNEDSLEFLQYVSIVLPLIESGMFDTAARYLETVATSEKLEKIKKELINCLEDADDVPK